MTIVLTQQMSVNFENERRLAAIRLVTRDEGVSVIRSIVELAIPALMRELSGRDGEGVITA